MNVTRFTVSIGHATRRAGLLPVTRPHMLTGCPEGVNNFHAVAIFLARLARQYAIIPMP